MFANFTVFLSSAVTWP